ncbi:MAG TPA: hypothetical protein VLA61_15725 [Ideonella sp.]|uniref:TolB family protein n=1 Tax=Ideonella sp. TaxID=1929293 RepID=UPI002B5448F8|nr:hypothetical protein [Ideonella sp.]HSI49720.1 hypothetical protein [Ideonella sp.]
MSIRRRKIIIICVLATTAAALGAHFVSGAVKGSGRGCGRSAEVPTTARLADMHIQQPLLLFLAHGRMVRRNLTSGSDTVLSDHGFLFEPSVVRSADGRWISYSGELTDERRTQYWLYDMWSGQDRLVLETPAWGGSIPVFSPDGHYLAVAANYDSRWPDASMAGTYVFDTSTLKASRLGIPAAAPADTAWTDPEWSADGSRLLLMTIDERSGREHPREYRSWAPGTPAATPIEAQWVEEPQSGIGHSVWRLDGAEVPVFEQRLLQGQGGNAPTTSPDGSWTVKVLEPDGEAALEVTDRTGNTRRVDTGNYDGCEGFAFKLVGWIDPAHLVYRKPGPVTLVVEPATSRVAPLLQTHDQSYLLGW